MSALTVMTYGFATERWKADVQAHMGLTMPVAYVGALDGLDQDALDALKPDQGEGDAPVQLPDGSTGWFDIARIDQRCHDLMASRDDAITLMYCTAPWDQLAQCSNVLLPFRMLESTALNLMDRSGKLGVIQPYAETAEQEIQHWAELGVPVVSRVAASENEDLSILQNAAMDLEAEGASVIVLDCLYFTQAHYQAVRDAVQCPVLMPNSLIGQMLNATLT